MKAASGIPAFVSAFEYKVGNLISMLYSATGQNLWTCLGVIMNKYPFSSLTAELFTEELTKCPQISFDVTEFMQYWLHEELLPILKLEVDSSKQIAKFSYTFHCDVVEMNQSSSNCLPKKYAPQFAVKFHNVNQKELQKVEIITDKYNEIEFTFSLEEHQILLVNAFEGRNFLVQYPEVCYENFFKWVQSDTFTNSTEERKYLEIYILDIFHISVRGLISFDWLVKILNSQSLLKQKGLLGDQGVFQ